MSHAAQRITEHIQPSSESYLGPAEVVIAEAGAVSVALPAGGVVRAKLALAYPYEPAVGDVLLVIGRREDHYVIGVLHGSGRAVLSFQGDVALRAVGGSLSLSGDQGIDLHGPAVEVHTGTLRMVADAAVQTFTSLCQRVTSMLSSHAGESHTVVEGASHTQAKSASILTAETMTINGKQIHLG